MWTIDRKLKIKIGEKDALLNIIYDKKLKKLKKYCSWGFEGEIFLRVPENMTDEELIRYFNIPIIRKWYYNAEEENKGSRKEHEEKIKDLKPLEDRSIEELRTIIEKYVDKFTPQFGRPKQIIIRNIFDVWANCNHGKDRLTFTPPMKYLPEDMIEFIVYHEMIHTYCLNHNPPFYREMAKRYPDWKEWDEKLWYYSYKIRREHDNIFF